MSHQHALFSALCTHPHSRPLPSKPRDIQASFCGCCPHYRRGSTKGAVPQGAWAADCPSTPRSSIDQQLSFPTASPYIHPPTSRLREQPRKAKLSSSLFITTYLWQPLAHSPSATDLPLATIPGTSKFHHEPSPTRVRTQKIRSLGKLAGLALPVPDFQQSKPYVVKTEEMFGQGHDDECGNLPSF